MKSIILIIISIFSFYACSNNRAEIKDNNEVAEYSIDSFLKIDSINIQNHNEINLEGKINYTDEKGLKQGKWIIQGLKGKIIEIKNYKNDTLHGLHQYFEGITLTGNYIMGKKDGYQYAYYKYPNSVLSVSFYKNDSCIWIGFPLANENLLIPIKSFYSNRDSIFISAPYENGKIWYEGYFCLSPSKSNKGRIMTYSYGVHKIFYRNGNLKGMVDYKNEIIQEFDSFGNKLYTAKFEELEKHKQTLEISFFKNQRNINKP